MATFKSRMAVMAALVVVAVPLMSACGGEAATPTVVVAPTNTTAPVADTPTTAMAADTPTAAMEANTPTAAMAADTPTAAMAGETPTAMMMGETPTAMMGATPGAGAMMGVAGLAAEGLTPDTKASGKFEFFSWWTAGGEAEGKNDLLNLYKQLYPSVDLVDAAVAGGGGDKAKAVLKTRMQGNDPPDTFQVHGGPELLAGYVAPGRMEPVTSIYKDMNATGAFPKQLLDLVSQGGEIYAVPANIHRGNVLFYNKKFATGGSMAQMTSWDDFFTVADALKAKGTTPLAVGGKDPWSVTMLFEDILLTTAGPDKFTQLMQGKADWTDASVVKALDILKKVWTGGYVNKDSAALTWDDALGQVINGTAAMSIMGDWAKGNLQAKDPKWADDFGWQPSPGTTGIFKVIVDSFGLPKGAKNPDNTKDFLKLMASKTGQVTFNLRKGSIPARTDVDTSQFDVYMKDAAKDFASAKSLVGSAPHGSATVEAFASALTTAINTFVSNPADSAAAAKQIQSQATDLLK